MTRVCRVCRISKEDSEFRKSERACKKCTSKIKADKAKDRYNEILKNGGSIRCSKCGNTKKAEEFSIGNTWCKECMKKYHEVNKEHLNKLGKENYKNNIDAYKGRATKRYIENKDEINEYKKGWYTENKDEISKKKSEYSKTPQGKEVKRKGNSKRKRNLGYMPINKYFNGSVFHHLRYTNSINSTDKDNDIGIYIPKEIHFPGSHDGDTGRGMKKQNIIALGWYLKTTPTNELNPISNILYNNYVSLPAPKW